MANKKIVTFTAKKTITKPIVVKFKTREGKVISFISKKIVTEPIEVKFKAKK